MRIGWLVLANAINLVEQMKGGTDGERERERDREDINMKEEEESPQLLYFLQRQRKTHLPPPS